MPLAFNVVIEYTKEYVYQVTFSIPHKIVQFQCLIQNNFLLLGVNKMVYYTALPLIMQADPNTTQICASVKSEDESSRMMSPGNNLLFPDNEQYNHLNQRRDKLALPQYMNSLPAQHQQHSLATSPQHHRLPTPTQKKPAQSKSQFKCHQCNMVFGSKSAHTSHVKSHVKSVQQNGSTASGDLGAAGPTSADPYQCDVCKKTFAVPARLVC